MKKIVFLRINPKAVGGAEKYLQRVVYVLKQNGIKHEIRSFNGNQKIPSWLKALKFNHQVCKQKSKDEIYFSLERVGCADIYRAGDGVHKVYRNQKKLWFLNPLNFVYPYLERKCFENSKKIITNSNFIKDQIIKTYNINPQKIQTIYNGVNLPNKVDKVKTKTEICAKFNLDLKKPLILFVGSGFKRKGVKEFLTILKNLNSNYSSIIIGKDKNIKKYINLTKNLGLDTLFLGVRDDVNKFYEASDIFVFPTYYEPFSNVILEALSYGCVCFTTKQNGASEILDNEFIMNSPNDLKISKTIDKFLNNASLLQTQSQKNIEISKKFSIENNVKLTMEIINENLY
ncbi:glycosyltransferase family 4 protein [Campylobacter corcagiensis]|uniref:Glycosyltransferase family 4 protein n=1 Tax=Campylobacter corcagiensis TaxID=1448857 RepID=A0A7M1LDZ5_9BACT|nr:glycosyltransferase family 4 protein [Campylobacter corcagiensis]QKF65084.1 glycosyltransferase, family 1 [Campylobacter corcagiensis]QOQ86768.1 glycosyltransferase family 4 protein [Campylobacter corcagiensis]